MDQNDLGISLKTLTLTKPRVRFSEGMEKRKVYRRVGKGLS
jgi:hypothetical protein